MAQFTVSTDELVPLTLPPTSEVYLTTDVPGAAVEVVTSVENDEMANAVNVIRIVSINGATAPADDSPPVEDPPPGA